MQHHERAIEAFVERTRVDEATLAVIVDGSVAHGTERPDSDVDLYLIVTDEEFRAAGRDRRLSYVDRVGADYPGGYFDIKLATLPYLDQAGERGDDPVRASFLGARIVWSRVDGLEQRLRRITEPPPEQWAQRAASYLSQARLYGGYFLRQAVEHDNVFLLHHAAVHLAIAAGRALLAYNKVLFAGPKYLTAQVAGLAQRPDGIEHLLTALVAHPSIETGRAVMDAVEAFGSWPWHPDDALSTFVHDNELAWLHRTLPPEYA